MLVTKWLNGIKNWVLNLLQITDEEKPTDYPMLTIQYFKQGNICLFARDTIGSVITIRIRHQESLKDLIIAVDNLQEIRRYSLSLKAKETFKKKGELEKQIKNDDYLYAKYLSHRFLIAWIPVGISLNDKTLDVIAIIDGDFIDKSLSKYGTTGDNKVAFDLAMSISKEIATLKQVNHLFWFNRVNQYDFYDVLNERLTHRFKTERRLKQYFKIKQTTKQSTQLQIKTVV